MRRRLIAALAALALLAVPAVALAQSAGDEQYTDPFGDVNQPTQDDGTANGSPAPATDQTAQAPASGSGSASAAGADQGSGGSLPHTGFPALLSALLGALLLGSGISVRRRAQPVAALPPWLVPAASRRSRFGARRRRRR
jgi:LPXTG-motif cell wall-anchored protein